MPSPPEAAFGGSLRRVRGQVIAGFHTAERRTLHHVGSFLGGIAVSGNDRTRLRAQG